MLTDNVPLYRSGSAPYKDNNNRPERLRQDPAERIGRHHVRGLTAFFAGNIAISEALHVAASVERPVQAIVTGAVAGGLALGGLIIGGNATNSLGHGGEKPLRAFWRSMIGRMRGISSPPQVRSDGTFTTDEAILGPLTFDEAGNQRSHHDEPGNIAYPTKQIDLAKFLRAPFGTTLEFMTRHHILMEPGNNFKELIDAGKPRPDMPSEAVLLLEAARRETLKARRSLETAA